MKVGIYYNTKRVPEEALLNLHSRLLERGAEPILFSSAESIGGVDRLIVMGGDGTILHVAQRTSELEIPLVGINFGTRGFLAEFERSELEDVPSFVLGDCKILQRSMLEISFRNVTRHCLNELVMLRRHKTEVPDSAVCITATLNGESAGIFTADGLIVATPTGSTAYSLSAGGCIMTPDCNAFILTPICASSLRSRPIVYPDTSILSFSFENAEDRLILEGDGICFGEMLSGDTLTVKQSRRTTRFLTKESNGFFHRLTMKIN